MKLHSVSIARYILNGREPVLCEDLQRCVRGAGLVEPASLSMARELARRTIKKAGKMNVACLIERSFHGYQPSK